MTDWIMLIADTPQALVERISGRNAEDGQLNAAQLLELFAEFCDEPVTDSLPIDEDGDALLLQYGSTTLRAQQVFYIDCVRQLTKAATDVDEQSIYQLHMTFYWPATPETETLGSHNAWLMGYEPDAESEAYWENLFAQPGWEWFMSSGAALDARCEIYFEGVDEPAEADFGVYAFEITHILGAHPVVLPYEFNQQPLGCGWVGPTRSRL